MFNKLLLRQIQKHLGGLNELPEKYLSFFKVISESYDHFEKDRKMLERSIELSSNEMIELNNSLRQSETNLRTILDNADTGYILIGKELNVISFNQKANAIYKHEFKKPLVEGIQLLDYFPHEKHQYIKSYLLLALAGESVNYEVSYLQKDGSLRWYNIRFFGVLNSKKEVFAVTNSITDITERKRAVESLQKSEANLRNLLENTDTAYVLLDNKATILSFNHIASEMSKEDLLEELSEGKNYIALMPTHRERDVKEAIKLVLKEGIQLSYETNYKKDGKPDKWLHVRMHPIFNGNGHVLGLSVAATNITNRKIAEQQIKESNERYEMVTKATHDIIWDWDLVNDKMYRSEMYNHVFGNNGLYSSDYTQSWLQRIHFEDRKRIVNSIKEKVSNPDSILWETEYRYFRSNGEIAYVQDRGYIIHDENKRPVRMVGAMRDITAEKLFEIERNKITTDLMQRNKDLEQFAYIVSHNLRAPVANVIGFADNLADESLDKNIKAKLTQQLGVSVRKLDMVIKDLNSVLQLKHQINESIEKISFSRIVEDIKLSISNTISSESVSIETNFSAVDHFFTIKSYFYSIFYNLILNSIKYKKENIPPVIKISSCKFEDRILLKLTDNGLGIDLQKSGEQVFGLYKRFHTHIEGKGMGLFMVKTQVEALGGKINILSEVNKGTEFLIQFPI